MNRAEREIVVMILERLQYFEKTRMEDLASLIALTRTVCSRSPAVLDRYKLEKEAAQEKQATNPASSLDDVYDGLIRLLKDPAPAEEDQQEKLRRLLEAFEGPKQ